MHDETQDKDQLQVFEALDEAAALYSDYVELAQLADSAVPVDTEDVAFERDTTHPLGLVVDTGR